MFYVIGYEVIGRWQSFRILMGAFWFVVIMMTSLYTGSLTASLAVNDVTKPFDTLDGLAADKDYILQILQGSFREQLFRVRYRRTMSLKYCRNLFMSQKDFLS
jgi:hypothetical protein